jgi:hypothetical protein
MRVEHLKEWLQGMRQEEESEGANTIAGDQWRALIKLVQTVWDEGRIPPNWGGLSWSLSQKVEADIARLVCSNRYGKSSSA